MTVERWAPFNDAEKATIAVALAHFCAHVARDDISREAKLQGLVVPLDLAAEICESQGDPIDPELLASTRRLSQAISSHAQANGGGDQ
jgi:hypothetical protein